MNLQLLFGQSWTSRALLVLSIACLYAGAIVINNQLLFGWSRFDDLQYLIFVPAGLKLLLVMLFGLRAVAGIAIGITATTLDALDQLPLLSACIIGIASSISTYIGLTLVATWRRLSYPWNGLSLGDLSLLALVVGSLDALVSDLMLVMVEREAASHVLAELPYAAFGRIVGSFLFMGGCGVLCRTIIGKHGKPAE